MNQKDNTAIQHHTSINPKISHKPEAQLKIGIGKDVFIINHAYTGSHTIKEVYEDFLKRAITNG